jgi:hypothetical protein
VTADALATTTRSTAEALALLDAAPPVEPQFMIGTWHGAELSTGYPLDGLLAGRRVVE